jgi:hypothetical protein
LRGVFPGIDPETGRPVPYGERGQVVTNHISKIMFVPNNLERDTVIRAQRARWAIRWRGATSSAGREALAKKRGPAIPTAASGVATKPWGKY